MTVHGLNKRILTGLALLALAPLPGLAQVAATPVTAPTGAPAPADEDGPISTKANRVSAQMLAVPTMLDAPAEDFDRVAWCHGILSGHMDIAERIGDDDPSMRTIGKNYLKTYEAALTLSKDGQAPEGQKRASAWQKKGFEQWGTVRAAIKEKQAGAYMNWMLPAECEKASVRISGHPNLFAEMQDEKEAALIGATLKRGPQSTDKPRAAAKSKKKS
jgi:hypothetical protein